MIIVMMIIIMIIITIVMVNQGSKLGGVGEPRAP